jgi:hypothetical protein
MELFAMKFTKALLAVLLLLIFGYCNSLADINIYQFSQESGTYSSFTDGDMLEDSDDEYDGDDKYWEEVEIGFDFEFYGETFSYVGINSNGFVQLGDYTSDYAYVTWPLSDTDFQYTLIGFNNDLQPQSDGSSDIQVKLLGSSPNRVFVIQWTNFRICGYDDHSLNFQIRLLENGNKVQYVYGEITVAEYQYDTQVGLRGYDDDEDIQCRYVYYGENEWSDSQYSNYAYDYCELDTDLYPEEGLTYTYFIPSMEYSSSEAFQNSNNVSVGVADTWIIGVVVSTEGTSNPLSITGLDFNTNGTTDATDITNAKLFYTGSSNVFSTSDQFGSTINDPNGDFSFSDELELEEGNNYFWLAYSISEYATTGNVVDAQCTSLDIYSSVDEETNSYTPNPSAPTGLLWDRCQAFTM